MRLSSIKLSGFKSFSDQTSLVFPSDRTVLVGPNGCGKSNVIDAIRWVLGASSASGLRSDSMEDVIFNGTDDNPPRGRAMVEMVFANNKNRLTGKYQDLPEVKIKRVLERDRDSRYYINDVPCLKKNITELFAGMGLTGKTDYAIVTQGAVHNIVESNPEYIRTVIEEVADITSYLNKRKDSLNHIRRTKENLRTIHSNLAEMKHRVKALEKQSEMAKLYKDNQDELVQLKEQLTLSRYNQLVNKKEAKRITLNQLVEKISSIKNNSALWESQKQEISLDVDEKNKDLIADMNKQRELNDAIATTEAGNKYNRKNLEDKEQQLSSTKEEAKQISNRLQEQLNKLNETDRELKQLKELNKQALNNDNSKETNTSSSLNRIRELEKQIHASGSEWQEIINAGMIIHASHKDLEVKLKESLASQEELIKQIEEISHKQKTYKDTQQELVSLNKEKKIISNKIASLNKQEQALLKDTAALEEKLSKNEKQLRKCADEHLRIGTLLQELNKADYEPGKGLSANIKKILSTININTNNLWGDKVEVADGWEKALDLVASRLLQANFTENISSALESLVKEKDLQLGLIEQSINGINSSGKQESLGTARSLAQLIKHNNKPSFLNHIYSCDDLQQALKLRKQLQSHQSIVTPRGDWLGPDWAVLQNESINSHNPGSVARKKRHAELEKIFTQNAKQKESIETALSKLKVSQDKTNKNLHGIRNELQQLKQQASKNEQALIGKQTLFNGFAELKPELLIKQKEKLGEIEKQVSRSQKDLLKAEEGKIKQDETRKSLEDKRNDLTSKLTELQEQRQQQETLQQQEQERREELLTIKSSLETELITLRTGEEKLKLRNEELLESTFVSRNAVKQDDTKLAELTKSNDKLSKTIAAKEKNMTQLGERLREVEKNLARGEKDVAVFEEKIDQSKGDEQQLELEMGELEKRIPRVPKAVKVLDDLSDPATIQTRINILQRENDRMGDVNMLALKDYKEEKDKYDNLLMQEQEINKALDNLNKAIKRIDRESKSRFDATFAKVNKSFGKLFSTLTQGGKGTLQVDTNENGKNGIRIMASPPGKRNTMLSLLSGGEKTVTAIAFIMAIFQLNPAPFCLLDEADAMLDDHNIARFNSMMDEMAAASAIQFIVITHSKLSMQNAKHLIGVTMSEPGVSRIVTVDMDKAVELSQADA